MLRHPDQDLAQPSTTDNLAWLAQQPAAPKTAFVMAYAPPTIDARSNVLLAQLQLGPGYITCYSE